MSPRFPENQGGRVEEAAPGLAMKPCYPVVNHFIGSWPDNGGHHHIEVKVIHLPVFLKGKLGTHLGEDLPSGRTLKIENSESVPSVKNPDGLRVMEGIQLRILDPEAMVFLHHRQAIPDNRQTPVAKDIDFHQAPFFHGIFLP
jgi:hypothetical protein